MKIKNKNSGFTLIELLVVISIIALLSSIVIASLSSARTKAVDSKVKQTLVSVRSQAGIIYSNSGCYGDGDAGDTTCVAVTAADCVNTTPNSLFSNATVWSQISSAKTATAGLVSCAASASGATFAVAVQLKNDLAKAWCVDSTGASKQISDASNYVQNTLNADITGGVCGT